MCLAAPTCVCVGVCVCVCARVVSCSLFDAGHAELRLNSGPTPAQPRSSRCVLHWSLCCGVDHMFKSLRIMVSERMSLHSSLALSGLLAMAAHPSNVKVNVQMQGGTRGGPLVTATSTSSDSVFITIPNMSNAVPAVPKTSTDTTGGRRSSALAERPFATAVPEFHPCSKLHGLRSPCARRMWLEFIVSGKVPIASKKRSHISRKSKKQKASQSWTAGITVATHVRRRLRRKCGQASWYSSISYSTPSKRKCLESSPTIPEVMNCKCPGSIREYQIVANSTSSYSTPSKTRSTNSRLADPRITHRV